MAKPAGLTAELYQAVVTIVDDRMREIRVTREDFDALQGVVSELTQAQPHTETRLDRVEQALERLAAAQERTDAAVRQLAEAQARTEASVKELAEAQARTETRLDRVEQALERLAEAQARTEQVMRDLAQQVGRLSDSVGFGLEDIARVVLPGHLQLQLGLRLDFLQRRLFRVDGEIIELDLYGEGKRDGRHTVLLGEVKSRIYRREVEQFLRQLAKVEPLVEGDVVRLMFGFFIDLSAEEAAAGKDLLLIASYEPVTKALAMARRSQD